MGPAMATAQKLKDEGKTYQIAFTAAQYEGYVVNVNNMLTAYGATFVNEDSSKATLDDKAVQGLDAAEQAVDLRADQRVACRTPRSRRSSPTSRPAGRRSR